MFRYLHSLRFRLLCLVLLAVVPALGLILHTASDQRRQAGIQAQENALRLVRAAASSQEQLIGTTQQLLFVTAQLPAVRERDPIVCNQVLANLLKHNPRLTAIGVAEVVGPRRCGAYPPEFSPDTVVNSPALTNVFNQAVARRNSVIGEYGIGPYSRRGVLTFAYPLLDDDDQVVAVLTCTLDVASLNQLVSQSLLPPGSTFTVNDRNGTILAHFPEPERWVGKSAAQVPIIQTVLDQQREGTAETTGEDGVSRLYAFARLNSLPSDDIYVSVGIPTAVAYAEANQTLERNLLAIGLVAILALGAAWFGGDLFFLRQIDELIRDTGRLAGGDLRSRPGQLYGAGELGQLAHAFDRMVAALEQREAERRQAADQVRQQAARAEALVQVAGRLSAQLDVHCVAEAICEESVQALRVQAASVNLFDVTEDLFRPVASCGLPAGYDASVPPWPRAACEPWVSQPDAILVSAEVADLPDWPEAVLGPRPDIRTVIRVALLRERQWVGLLSLYALGAPRDLDEDDRMLLKGLAAQAALAIANAQLYEVLQHQERTRAELLHQAITAQEDERMRIARELHDETSQSLTALIVGIDTARMMLMSNTAKADEYLQNARNNTKRMLEDIRRLVSDLRPTLLDDMGLIPAIAWYGEQRLKPAGILLHLDRGALPERLPVAMETVLFRIVQEALSNVVRHAQASAVDLRLVRTAGDVTLQVADNGHGFHLAPHWPDSSGQGFGLRGMRERARILGGDLNLQTGPNEGTVITVRIPIPIERISHVNHSRALGG